MPIASVFIILLFLASLIFFILLRRRTNLPTYSPTERSHRLLKDFKNGVEEARIVLFKIHFTRLQIFLIIIERKGIISKRPIGEYRAIAMLALEELWTHRNAIKTEKDIDEMLFQYVIKLLVQLKRSNSNS